MDPLTFTRNYDPLQDVTYSCVDASARLALATTRLAQRLLLVFVAIGPLSTSIHLCLRGRDVNPK